MNCKHFQDLITPAVDRVLGTTELDQFLEHAKACPPCRYEYEGELATKDLVARRARMVPTPPALVSAISESLVRERTNSSTPRSSWSRFLESLRAPYVRPAIGLALSAIALVYVGVDLTMNHGTIPMTSSDRDVMRQSINNYRSVLSGTIVPQVVSARHDDVLRFFDGKTGFPVLVPKLRHCDLVGGVASSYGTTPLAHVVYKHNDKLVYVYEACWKTVQKGENLKLPRRVTASLLRTGWYTDTLPDGSTIALWVRGETLCAALADLPKDELIACLKNDESGDGAPW